MDNNNLNDDNEDLYSCNDANASGNVTLSRLESRDKIGRYHCLSYDSHDSRHSTPALDNMFLSASEDNTNSSYPNLSSPGPTALQPGRVKFASFSQLSQCLPVLSPAPTVLRSVLVVDDSVMNRKMVQKSLQNALMSASNEHDCVVIDTASDGRNCIEKFIQYAKNHNGVGYDVIMMDFIMPNLNGPNTTRELRSMGHQGLIVGVTGASLQSDIDDFTTAGADHVMIKPLDINHFIDYCSSKYLI